jgi:hypothetical protein
VLVVLVVVIVGVYFALRKVEKVIKGRRLGDMNRNREWKSQERRE